VLDSAGVKNGTSFLVLGPLENSSELKSVIDQSLFNTDR
jgi:hypothetical protein